MARLRVSGGSAGTGSLGKDRVSWKQGEGGKEKFLSGPKGFMVEFLKDL